MKYLALAALIASTNAVPIVGGITKEIACKDEVDIANGDANYLKADCEYDYANEDLYQCYTYMPLADEGIVAADWADASTQCEALFDTGAGDKKCVSLTYDGTPSGAFCTAYTTSAQEVYSDAYLATFDLMILLLPDYMYGSGLGGMNLAAGSAAATLAAALYM